MLLLSGGCSLALDFEDVEDLPCPCDDEHVCLTTKMGCVPRASVDDFKACSVDTDPPGGDLLCQGTAICENIMQRGHQCLPTCTPKSYALAEASAEIGTECRTGTTCFDTARGGVCGEGVCDSSPASCGVGQECQFFNGAGICFTVCEIYRRLDEPCANGQVCHPIGNSQTTACLEPGAGLRNESCSLERLCQGKDEFGRAMICSRPQVTPQAAPRCFPICLPGDGTCNGNCIPATNGVDRISQAPVHICEGEP